MKFAAEKQLWDGRMCRYCETLAKTFTRMTRSREQCANFHFAPSWEELLWIYLFLRARFAPRTFCLEHENSNLKTFGYAKAVVDAQAHFTVGCVQNRWWPCVIFVLTRHRSSTQNSIFYQCCFANNYGNSIIIYSKLLHEANSPRGLLDGGNFWTTPDGKVKSVIQNYFFA